MLLCYLQQSLRKELNSFLILILNLKDRVSSKYPIEDMLLDGIVLEEKSEAILIIMLPFIQEDLNLQKIGDVLC
jgi:hypothetical protein